MVTSFCEVKPHLAHVSFVVTVPSIPYATPSLTFSHVRSYSPGALTNTGTRWKQQHMPSTVYSSTWPTPVVCQQMKRSCRTACAGDRGRINITTVTAHQLMFITHHTQHLKKGNHISPLSGKETAKTEPTEVKCN